MNQASTKISVIVPCRNEQQYIKETIKRILGQKGINIRFDLELILVDGKSTDNTLFVIKNEIGYSKNVKLVINEKKITPTAFNLGIRTATGEYICIIGAHAQIAKDYLYNCLTTMEKMNVDNVGGPWKAIGQNYIGKAIALGFQSPFAVGGAKSRRVNYEGYVDTVWGGFYKKDVFNKIGLFDEELIRNQDDELNYRLIKAGGKIWQAPSIKYSYICRNSIRSLFRQYMQYGYWKVRVIQKHYLPASIRHLIPGIFVGILLTLSILSIFLSQMVIYFKGLLSIYLAFVLIFSVMASLPSTNLRFLPIMPIVFSCFHFGYGIGFLKGVWDFVILRKHKTKNISDVSLTR